MGDVLMKSTLAVDHSSTAVATPISHSTAVATAPDTMNRPLRLLDLPVDILKDIVKEVTHTNDLTSLALCHSALHRLVIPHIYSRFDIVWPDSAIPTEPRTGVDALTYGLATLVMAEEVFGDASRRSMANGTLSPRTDDSVRDPSAMAIHNQKLDARVRRRRGNYYAQFTRKFSLGNGPPEWVQEYLINKEGGKMLGTLVALAVARMRNLDTFIWDMPTGILRDVWLSLSSLADHDDGKPCRLDRVAVRFHDNSPEPHALSHHHSSNIAHPPLHALDNVEHPSFSVLPALESLSVFDIDELQYLDEMSVLIGRSQAKLRELRVGIARHVDRDWTTVWDGGQLQQIDKDNPTASSVTIGEKRLAGVLGVLTAYVCDIRRTCTLPHRPKRLRRRSNVTINTPLQLVMTGAAAGATSTMDLPHTAMEGHVHSVLDAEPSGNSEILDEADVPPVDSVEVGPSTVGSPTSTKATEEENNDVESTSDPAASAADTTHVNAPTTASTAGESTGHLGAQSEGEDHRLSGKLALETLELERVPLSIPVLQNVIDWTKLTSLTLLQCPNNEHLWKSLRRLYSPTGSKSRLYTTTADPSQSKQKLPRTPASSSEYRLNFKKIHTDTVSSALINFIKEALAPNTLKVAFFQDNSSNPSPVTIDTIFRGVLRKHRSSLTKILIDSSERGLDGQLLSSPKSKRWMLNREMLDFMTCGKMPVLRELGATLNHDDWHYFLQRLPSIPHLRSLYIPYMANYVHGSQITEPKDLALQIVDIIALRPEVELCYVGMARKCFEILENRRERDNHSAEIPSDDDDDADDEDDVDDDDDDDDEQSQHSSSDGSETVDNDSDDGMEIPKGAQLTLREILYYDDKVTIFKARHGKL